MDARGRVLVFRTPDKGQRLSAPSAPLSALLGLSLGCMLRCTLGPGTGGSSPVN